MILRKVLALLVVMLVVVGLGPTYVSFVETASAETLNCSITSKTIRPVAEDDNNGWIWYGTSSGLVEAVDPNDCSVQKSVDIGNTLIGSVEVDETANVVYFADDTSTPNVWAYNISDMSQRWTNELLDGSGVIGDGIAINEGSEEVYFVSFTSGSGWAEAYHLNGTRKWNVSVSTSERVESVEYASLTDEILVGDNGGTLRFLDPVDGSELAAIQALNFLGIIFIDIDDSDDLAYTAGGSGRIETVDLSSRSVDTLVDHGDDAFTSIAVTQFGHVYGGWNADLGEDNIYEMHAVNITIIETHDFDSSNTFEAQDMAVLNLDGSLLLAHSEGNDLYIVDTERVAEYVVSGFVHDQQGDPVEGVTVSVSSVSSDTNVNGKYSMTLAAGDHTLLASEDPYEDGSIRISVTSTLSNQNITLGQLPRVKAPHGGNVIAEIGPPPLNQTVPNTETGKIRHRIDTVIESTMQRVSAAVAIITFDLFDPSSLIFAPEQARAEQDAEDFERTFNDHSDDFVQYLNYRYDASMNYSVIKVGFHRRTSATRYIIADVNGSEANYTRMTVVNETRKQPDYEINLKGFSSDTAADEVRWFHDNYVEENKSTDARVLFRMCSRHRGRNINGSLVDEFESESEVSC